MVIKEFAESKKIIELKLSAVTDEIVEHLFKLILMPNHNSANHWEKEIYSFLHDVNILKSTHKFPTETQILEWTYYKKKELFDNSTYMTKVIKEYEFEYEQPLHHDINSIEIFKDDIKYVALNYFIWLGKQLSESGRVFSYEVYDKLNELLSDIR